MYQNASRFKLLAACVYELLLLLALWMLCTWAFISLFGEATTGNRRYMLQFLLWVITGAYFVFCWHKSGQTLATKTWKIKLVNLQNNSLSLSQAIVRYGLASALILACGLGVFWMLVDKERLFLQDRLLKTRFIETG